MSQQLKPCLELLRVCKGKYFELWYKYTLLHWNWIDRPASESETAMAMLHKYE